MSEQITYKTIVTDNDIESVWGYADFGSISRRNLINEALLKVNAGFHTGHTATQILIDLFLISSNTRKLTKKGREYLYYAYAKHEV